MAYAAELYMHDLDKRAFDALNTFPKLIKLRDMYIKNVDEKAAKIRFLSSALRLGDNQMPEIYRPLVDISEKLGIGVPELYYVKSEEMNAATVGSSSPYIFVTSELIEKIPIELIPSVLAHECGHIACGHYLYHSIAQQIINGVANSPLSNIPGVGSILSPALVRALLFWDRCSELSADRAAVLCDGKAETTIDMLLKVHGYDRNVNRNEFIKQAIDLKAFVSESDSNRVIEQMLVAEESHPRLATRVYECYEWEKTYQYRCILDGTYTIKEADEEHLEEKEAISAEVSFSTTDADIEMKLPDGTSINLQNEIMRVNAEIEAYAGKDADKPLYALAVASGIISGIVDSVYVGELKVTDEGIGLANKQVNIFIQDYAKSRGLGGPRLKQAISDLEQSFKVAQDNIWKGADIGVSASNHHLADLAHHPTPVGLVSAIVVQFLRVGTFVNKKGEWHFVPVKTDLRELAIIWAPAVISGLLNWLVFMGDKDDDEESDRVTPEFIRKLSHGIASTPLLIEIAKCADKWFGHMVSDMGGSKNTAGAGMGVPGIIMSLLYEISSLPGLKDSGLPLIIDEVYEKGKIDLREEVALYNVLKEQAFPVVLNEVITRVLFFVWRLFEELNQTEIKAVNWRRVIPFKNPIADRMIAISSMTFSIADTIDAAVHAALESAGNGIIFSGKFVSRFNYLGAGRAAIAIVKQISNEKKEAQLIHEKLLLCNALASFKLSEYHAYKAWLEERLTTYLAEDILTFMEGFDYIQSGVSSGNSDDVIKGNIIIQKVLGRNPQFTNQKEFDELMDSDIALVL